MLTFTGGLRAVGMAGNATRSLRFRASASAYLNRTLSSTETGTLWNYSAWIKRGTLGASQHIISGGPSGTSYTSCWFTSADTLLFQQSSGTVSINLETTQVFRDTASWYHIVISYDSSQAVSSNRFKLYVNGSLSSLTGTYPALNQGTYIGGASQAQAIGRFSGVATEYFDGYMADINFVTGQALDASAFGQINTTTGVWSPKRFVGAYGNNGFYLRFTDNSSILSTGIGKDFSGKGNNWTPNNVSITSGNTYDSMLDIPANNYCTINYNNSNRELNDVDGNLRIKISNGRSAASTFAMSSGTWYCEMSATATAAIVGVFRDTVFNPAAGTTQSFTEGWGYISSGNKRVLGVDTSYAAAWNPGDIIGLAYNADTGVLYTYVNGTQVGVGISGIAGSVVFGAYGNTGTTGLYAYMNFGQRPFQYTPPTGYLALCSANLVLNSQIYDIQAVAATTYTGTGAALSVVNTTNGKSIQPDLVWIKGRSGATNHALYDSARGATIDLVSNSTAAETTQTTGLTSFDSAGFSVGTLAKLNTNAATYVAWQWSRISFDIVAFTGSGSNLSVTNPLGTPLSMIIAKSRSGVGSWAVYHKSLGTNGVDRVLYLDTTAAVATTANVWPSASTASFITFGSVINPSGQSIVAYCFAELAGVSKFGSYTGNGLADGPFVYCGFRPKFIMIKVTSTTGDWAMIDTTRNPVNVSGTTLLSNTAGVEGAALSIDILSNGFKIRSATLNNTSAATYVFAAFAENSIKYALAR